MKHFLIVPFLLVASCKDSEETPEAGVARKASDRVLPLEERAQRARAKRPPGEDPHRQAMLKLIDDQLQMELAEIKAERKAYLAELDAWKRGVDRAATLAELQDISDQIDGKPEAKAKLDRTLRQNREGMARIEGRLSLAEAQVAYAKRLEDAHLRALERIRELDEGKNPRLGVPAGR